MQRTIHPFGEPAMFSALICVHKVNENNNHVFTHQLFDNKQLNVSTHHINIFIPLSSPGFHYKRNCVKTQTLAKGLFFVK